jgi:hypothetical protein
MRRNAEPEERETESHMELKYCERCGGLWLRECGAGTVYCANCAGDISELPLPRRRPRGAALPVRRRALIEDYQKQDYAEEDCRPDGSEMEALGGAA